MPSRFISVFLSDLAQLVLYTLSHAPIAQLDRVTGFEPVGREFESLWARHIPPLFLSHANPHALSLLIQRAKPLASDNRKLSNGARVIGAVHLLSALANGVPFSILLI